MVKIAQDSCPQTLHVCAMPAAGLEYWHLFFPVQHCPTFKISNSGGHIVVIVDVLLFCSDGELRLY